MAINTGDSALHDLNVEVTLRAEEGLRAQEKAPRRPPPPLAIESSLLFGKRKSWIESDDDEWKLTFDLGKVQPNAEAWSDPVYIGSGHDGVVSGSLRAFADNLSERFELPVQLTFKTETRWYREDDEGPDDE